MKSQLFGPTAIGNGVFAFMLPATEKLFVDEHRTSSQATPRPSGVTVSVPCFRYWMLTSVISSSPRADGFIDLAMSTTVPS